MLTKTPAHHAEIKHVNVQLHSIREYIEKGTIIVEYGPKDTVLADLMTKSLVRNRHVGLMKLIRMVNCETMKKKEGSWCSAGAMSVCVQLHGTGQSANNGTVVLHINELLTNLGINRTEMSK